jgi:succinate-semialdehyde dehydrogenase/glutarate-semialdehyde dehydrogenase
MHWIDAGAPAGLYTNLPIFHDQSDRLIDDPRIKGVALTGSAEAGRSKDEAEAIQLANDADFGLGGSVFTADIARGRRVASQVEAGMVFVNNLSWSDPALPFGGIKNSGYGRELGDLGIEAFVNRKMVLFAAMAPPP